MSGFINDIPGELPVTEDLIRALLWLGNRVPGGFFIYRADDSQEIVYINRAALDILGCRDLEEFKALTNNTFRGLVYPEDYEAVQGSIESQIAESANESMDHVEYRVLRRDGTLRWVDDYGRIAQMSGYGDVYYVFIMDITDQRAAQEDKLSVELALAREKHASEVKNQFLFNLSHDIRTPMNAVMGFSELARRHMDDPELLSLYLDKTMDASRQMLTLLDDMLEMNSLEEGKVQLGRQVANLREQIGLSVEAFRPEAEKKGVALAEEIDLPDGDVLMDKGLFKRILGNLLSNAIKFTPAGGRVTVRARRGPVSESGYARFELEVADTGVGISEDFKKRVFKSFERESTSTETGTFGTGLGLSIVKRLLDLVGGTIAFESEKGRGSTFSMALPLKLAERPSAAQPLDEGRPAEPVGENRRRILLVEDIEINRDIAQALLEESGYAVDAVPDGCDAVDAIRQYPAGYYDLVLMDIQMPVMNGYEATRAIRSLPGADAASLPIVALSANAREEDRRMSFESGMNDHVAKPFDIDALVQIIDAYIERAQKPDAPERP